MSEDKVLVTNKKALRSKYGSSGLAAIEKAVGALIKADKKRGVDTRLVFLDQAGDMKPLDAPKVTKADDPRQNKVSVDAVFAALSPHYLVILGASDVVPHQRLINPVQDDDADVPSDLPYACDAPFGTDTAAFTTPSRVVSRLPGIVGGKDAAYLVKLLGTAANWSRRTQRSYKSHLAVSADVWKGSTKMTLKKLFGTTSKLDLCPLGGPGWTKARVQRRTHFFNLHGAPEDDNFYGEKNGDFPEAHQAPRLPGRVREGTVVAAECCYGAELYDPDPLGIHMGIANTYLGEGAYGFFGSTTVAYGPADGNGSADLICQFFIREVLNGASLGRAALMARQEYVSTTNSLDPIDLKTLAQFYLLGDASVHPVKPRTTTKSGQKAKSLGTRPERRKRLVTKAKRLLATTPVVGSKPRRGVGAKLRSALGRLAKEHDFEFETKIQRFVVQAPRIGRALSKSLSKSIAAKAAKAASAAGDSYYLMYSRLPAESKKMGAKVRRRGVEVVRRRRAIMLAHEKDGEIAEVKTLLPR